MCDGVWEARVDFGPGYRIGCLLCPIVRTERLRVSATMFDSMACPAPMGRTGGWTRRRRPVTGESCSAQHGLDQRGRLCVRRGERVEVVSRSAHHDTARIG